MKQTRKLRRVGTVVGGQTARVRRMRDWELPRRAKRLHLSELAEKEKNEESFDNLPELGDLDQEKGFEDDTSKPERLKETRDGINVAAVIRAHLAPPKRIAPKEKETIPSPPFRREHVPDEEAK